MSWFLATLLAIAYFLALVGAGWVTVGLKPGPLRSVFWVLPFVLAAVAPLVLPPSIPPIAEYAQYALVYLGLTTVLVWALRRQLRE